MSQDPSRRGAPPSRLPASPSAAPILVVLLAAAGCILAAVWAYAGRDAASQGPVKVGVLHSLSGTMAFSETSVAQATLMAIEELNRGGGVLGRTVQPVRVDGRSDGAAFARAAERLIDRDQVKVIFGCWTSASRRTVRPVIESRNHLLFYPVQYEGLEQSPNIVYLGAAPNQQILPAVKWVFDHLGRRIFLVGSDYVFPRTANAIIRDQVALLRGEVVGEAYLPLGSRAVEPVVAQIRRARPDAILNTINGDSNVAFFHALRARGITPAKVPTVSFSLAEDELRALGAAEMVGDYAAWNYFQRLPGEVNRAFVDRFRRRYGADRVTDDPIEAAYVGVLLWAQAVTDAGSPEPEFVRREIRGQSLLAPGGLVYVDGENQHTWKAVRLGRIRRDGQFDVVWDSRTPVRPIPYPVFRDREAWDQFLDDLRRGWGGRWENPER